MATLAEQDGQLRQLDVAVAAPVEPSRSFLEINLPIILFYAAIIPTGISVSLGSLVLFPYRILLLLCVPWLLLRLLRNFRVGLLPDWLVLFGSGWFMISMIVNRGLLPGLESGGRETIDLMLSYFVGRSTIRSADDLRRFLRMALPGLVLAGGIFAVESISRRLIIWPVFPTTAFEAMTQQYRYGLLRAWGPFPHPILGGIFLAWFFALYAGMWRKPVIAILGITVALTGVFSLSSASILLLIISAGTLAYAWGTRLLFGRVDWRLLLYGLLALIIVLETVTESGAVRLIIRNFALSPSSGYFRILIWEYGTQSVANNPWFGIGYEGYERLQWMYTQSIDNYWLLLAVRFGLPAAMAIGIAVLASIWNAERARKLLPRADSDLIIGLLVSLSATWLAAWTVALWFGVLVQFMFFVGMATNIYEHAKKSGGRPG